MGRLESKWFADGLSEPVKSTLERIEKLTQWLELAVSEGVDLPDEETAQALDSVLTSVLADLQNVYAREAHPLRGSAKNAWIRARELCRLRLLLIAKQLSPPPPSRYARLLRKKQPKRSYSWANTLKVLRAIYLAHASAYSTQPKGFWLLAHTLFLRCMQPDLEWNSALAQGRLLPGADVYRQLVLYSVANPYAMKSGYMSVATQILDFYCPMVRILDRAPVQDTARGLVIVNPQTDQEPRAVIRAEPADLSEQRLYVQLHDLTYELQHMAEGVARGGTLPVSFDSQVDLTRIETVETVTSILRSFAGVAARSTPRIPATGQIEYVSGFYNAWAVLTRDTAASNRGVEVATGSVVNQTITGVAFLIQPGSALPVRVGEVVLFRRPAQPTWRIGVVRWMEVDDQLRVLVGCQAVGLRSDAYTAYDQDGHEVPIIVAQVPTHVGDTTVLLPDHGAASDLQLAAEVGTGTSTFVLTDLRETHVDCVRYHFLTV